MRQPRQVPKHKYHVKLFKVFYKGDHMVSQKLAYEQDTFAVSIEQAINNARYRSGLAVRGWTNEFSDADRWLLKPECEVVCL